MSRDRGPTHVAPIARAAVTALVVLAGTVAGAAGCRGEGARGVAHATPDGAATAAGPDLVAGNCLICHAATMIAQQHKDTAGWNKTVTQMVAWGAPLRSADRPVLVAYLATRYPARRGGPAPHPAPRPAP